ncbi:hypothetical protein [Haliangium sp.]|uniref:hypothetical protein n=1 Tax=Haliangium sp. TaxID=2663208 RepID=UPI003D09F439
MSVFIIVFGLVLGVAGAAANLAVTHWRAGVVARRARTGRAGVGAAVASYPLALVGPAAAVLVAALIAPACAWSAAGAMIAARWLLLRRRVRGATSGAGGARGPERALAGDRALGRDGGRP